MTVMEMKTDFKTVHPHPCSPEDLNTTLLSSVSQPVLLTL